MAEAMESRAFGATKRRTNLYELEMNSMDYIVFLISVFTLLGSLYVRFFMLPLGPIFPYFEIL